MFHVLAGPTGSKPPALPPLSALLDRFGNPSAARLASAFGVSRATAHRWKAQDKAPRAVLLALYGASDRHGLADAAAQVAHAREGERLALAWCDALRADCQALRRELARVVALGDFGAANSPAMGASTPAQVLAAPAAVRTTAARATAARTTARPA